MTDELRLPCKESDTPDDWFIGRDGKQYPSDDLLDDDIRRAILEEANALELTGEERVTFIEKAQDRAEASAKKDALRRRRHARSECHDSCLFRTRCLGLAIEGEEIHGTWGGYYEEEIREIRREISRRRRGGGPHV